LAAPRLGLAPDHRLGDAGMGEERLLHLDGVHILAPDVARDLLEPDAREILAALPARGAATAADVARGAGTTTDDAIARLYELRSLGYVERHGEGWKLTRRAVISARAGQGGC
ncbi:hypothetical protein ABZ651_30495, partial [Streptomyces sp. NPDC007070]